MHYFKPSSMELYYTVALAIIMYHPVLQCTTIIYFCCTTMNKIHMTLLDNNEHLLKYTQISQIF